MNNDRLMPLVKLFFISVFLLAPASELLAQKYILSAGDIEDPAYEHVKIIGQDEKGFYMMQSNLSLNIQRDRIGFRNRKYKISYYSYDLAMIWSRRLENDDQSNIDLVTMFNNHPLILRSQWLKSENKVAFTTELISPSGSTMSKQSAGKVSYEKGSETVKARMLISKNNNTAAIIFEEVKEDSRVMHFIFLDTALHAFSSQDVLLGYSEKNLDITEASLTDDGQVALLAEHSEKKPEGKGRLIQYKLFLLGAGEKSFNEFAIQSDNKQMTEASLTIDNLNKKAVVTGFYNDNDSYTGTGIIFASVPLSGNQTVQLKVVSIDDNARIKLIGERNSGSNAGLYSYPIRKLVLRSDGGAVVIAEAAYYSEYSYYDYFTQSFTRRVEYHYDNVVILSIHTNGTVDWSTVLRKSQETIDDGGFLSSFACVQQSDKIDLLYNSDISRNNEVTLFSVNKKGESVTKNIATADAHINILPQSGKQVDENTLITAVLLKKKLYLMKVEL